MPSDALRVTAAHLHELAAAHSQVEAEISAASDLVSGVAGRLRISHGIAAAPTARVIARIEEIRRTAVQGISSESRALTESLGSVAHAYAATDSVSGIQIDRFLS